MTMCSQDEPVGATPFSIALNSPTNTDYFVISPEKNSPVDEIELRNIYLNGTKYSVSKTFQVSPETDPPDGGNNGADGNGNGGNGPANCEGIAGARHQWYTFLVREGDEDDSSYPPNSEGSLPSQRLRDDGKYEKIEELSLFVDEVNNQVTICVVAQTRGERFPHRRTYRGNFVQVNAHDYVVPYQVTFIPNLIIRMNRHSSALRSDLWQRLFSFKESTRQGPSIAEIFFKGLDENGNSLGFFIPSVRVWPPEVSVKATTLASTSFTLLVENKNEFEGTRLFWMLLPASESFPTANPDHTPDADVQLLARLTNLTDPPTAKGPLSGELIPAKSGDTNGVQEIVIDTGIESGTSYKVVAFFKTGGYTSLVSTSTQITTP